MAQPDIDVNDVLQSLGAQIANLTIQNASLQAQLVAYQKAEVEAPTGTLRPVPDLPNTDD